MTDRQELTDELGKRIAQLEADLAAVDQVLARRDALEGIPDRVGKILTAIRAAQATDPKAEIFKTLKRAEAAEERIARCHTMLSDCDSVLDPEVHHDLHQRLHTELSGDCPGACTAEKRIAALTAERDVQDLKQLTNERWERISELRAGLEAASRRAHNGQVSASHVQVGLAPATFHSGDYADCPHPDCVRDRQTIAGETPRA